MDKFFRTLLFLCLLMSVFISSSAQSCSSYRFSNNNLNYGTCTDLPQLNAFLHWNYHPANHTVDIAYRHTGATSGRWIAWALNINGRGMLGAQCLVAFTNSSTLVHAYTSPISTAQSGFSTSLAQGPLSFNVPSINAFSNSNEMIIFATLELPSGRTSFNHVWQEGPLSGDTPTAHSMSSANQNSLGTVDFATGQADSGGGATIPRLKKKNIHGVLNVVGWGILMPIGAIIARYLKVFKSADPAWFYLHVACQSSAYVIGVAGWATGIKLGSDSPTLKFNTHRNIGIVLFCLGTLQVFALLLRPKKDHKFRLYWNIYHYVVGYTVIILTIINIFEGFDILKPAKKWKNAYIGVLIFLGVVATLLEAFTWYIVLMRKKKAGSDKHAHVGNGVNGYHTRPQQAA